ncbi:MAG: hypothetical protein K6E39_01705 [Lachnospiraceae bacterium]|nr:hypothetical protein [Lachnospiraceae bacterium]
MENFIIFFNSFFNYIVLLLCFVAVGAIGGIVGAIMAKKKVAKNAGEETDKKDTDK